ncbi:MAG: hypothetical protein NZ455_08935 [Bacteroidia bacterium]|nr:hypothetical protein [Bacteroidia bacterium]MDW8347353.1 hypothetical protein [Bacteroidia bacterium]
MYFLFVGREFARKLRGYSFGDILKYQKKGIGYFFLGVSLPMARCARMGKIGVLRADGATPSPLVMGLAAYVGTVRSAAQHRSNSAVRSTPTRRSAKGHAPK